MKDICCWCNQEIDLDEGNMINQVFFGPKTLSEWYVCDRCLKLAREGVEAIQELVEQEDMRLYEEDPEEAEKS